MTFLKKFDIIYIKIRNEINKKKKELKNLAKRIADAELIIQTSSDKKEINDAKKKIIELSNHAIDLEDMIILDELVQDILSQKMS